MDRIDVHQHLLTRAFTEGIAAANLPGWSDYDLPAWSPAGAIAMMDGHGIATGVLSLSAPGTHFGDDAAARTLATAVNETQAEVVKDRPDRFGMFAVLPLPDVDGALETITHAYDDLGTDGVVLLANHRGTYLGDPSFDPVLAELDRRGAVVFVHPAVLPGPQVPGLTPALADFLLDTTRAALNLVTHDVPARFPRISFVLSHAGGFVPYAAYRFAELLGPSPLTPDGRTADGILEALRTFYLDTALSASPTALPSALAFARPGHVLFGSDWPYVDGAGVGRFGARLDDADLDPGTRRSIDRGAAETLFPRLARR